MLIIYSIVTEQSIGRMFIAGIIPGVLLAIAYGILILILAYVVPRFVGGQGDTGDASRSALLNSLVWTWEAAQREAAR